MTRADEIQIVSGDLCVWQAYEPAVKCDLTSTALRCDGHVVLIDPIALTAQATEELLDFGPPALVICSSGNHLRAAADFRQHYQIPLAADRDAVAELGIQPDLVLTEHSELPYGLGHLALPGAAAGEIAVRHPNGIVCLGDAVIHLDSTGLALLPEKYCSDAKQLPHSLRNLLQWEFEILTFAHGLPLLTSARQRLAALLP